MTEEQFEKLLRNPESSILDFKTNLYDFTDDIDNKTTAKLVKDVISFCNTIRTESSYVIFGVQENVDGSKTLLGIEKTIDDSILQQKVGSKIYPTPKFKYQTITYQNKIFGFIEFPICKYELPITSTLKLKGLIIGQAYYRQGTSNTEASTIETIRINEWLKTLPDHREHSTTLDEQIATILKDLTTTEKKLSTIISEMFSIAQKYGLNKLKDFCTYELQGFNEIKPGLDEAIFKYRIQSVFISQLKYEINPYNNYTASMMKREFEQNENVFEYRMLLSHSIVYLEEMLYRFNKDTTHSIAILSSNSKIVFPDRKGNEYPVYIYIFEDHIKNLYNHIRQNAIDRLMNSI